MTRLAQDGSSFCSRLSRWRRWEHIAHLFFFFLRPGLHQMNKRVYTMSCFNTRAVNVRLCSGTNEQHTKFECVCVRESKSEWVCKYSLHGRAIHSVVTVILRDCIDWSWWRMRYQAEGHLSLSVVSLSLCLTHTHTHTHSGTRLERPHEWIEMESNHTVKWLHNNFSFAVFALSRSFSCPSEVHRILTTEKGIQWQLTSSLLCTTLFFFIPWMCSTATVVHFMSQERLHLRFIFWQICFACVCAGSGWWEVSLIKEN